MHIKAYAKGTLVVATARDVRDDDGNIVWIPSVRIYRHVDEYGRYLVFRAGWITRAFALAVRYARGQGVPAEAPHAGDPGVAGEGAP